MFELRQLLPLAVTGAVAFAGGSALKRLKVPGGMVIGSVAATMALNLTTTLAYMPQLARRAAQICAGAFIACSVRREDLRALAKNWRAPLALLGCLLVLNLAAGTVLYALSDLDPVTCLMCAVPGGITDIPMIAGDMGGDQAIVLTAQFMRLILGLAVFPLAAARAEHGETTSGEERVETDGRRGGLLDFTLTCLFATVGGLAAKAAGIPAGTLIGALLGTLLWGLVSGRQYMPRPARRITQCLAGAYIGCSVGWESLHLMGRCAPGLAAVGAMYVAGCLLIARLLSGCCGLGRRAALLAAMPAGASDVALIASDMKVSVPEVALLQLIRMVAVVTVFPQVIYLLSSLGFPFF